MFTLSCFADEISTELDEQLQVLQENQIQYLELRSVFEKNVLDLTDAEVTVLQQRLDACGIGVSSIGSPIGKVNVGDDFDAHMERLERALEIAVRLNTRYVRVFSFFMEEREVGLYENTVFSRMRKMVDLAEAKDIILLHENESGIYGQSSERCRRMLEAVDHPNLRAVFDPANFILAGEDVWNQSFAALHPFIEYVHVKDARRETGEMVIVGQGDGDFPQVLAALKDSKELFLSLEPHLLRGGRFGGFTGPELFGEDAEALKQMLTGLEIDFR